MKAKPTIFLGVVAVALCLPAPTGLQAQAVINQPGSAIPPQHSTTVVNGNGTVSQSGSYGTAYVPEQYRYPAPVNKASDLIGMKVINQHNETLGKVRDIVFDLQSGRVAYVVVEKAGRTHGTGPNISVPLNAFTPTADSRHLVLNSSKSQVQNTWGFSTGNYPPMANPVYGAQPVQQPPVAQPPVEQKEHIIIVPVPVAPDQDQDLSPNHDPHQDTSPDHGSDHTY